MVDIGVRGSAPKNLPALAREELAPSDVALILITYRHVDHIGSAAAIKRTTVAIHTLNADGLHHGDGGLRPRSGWDRPIVDLTGFPSERAEP